LALSSYAKNRSSLIDLVSESTEIDGVFRRERLVAAAAPLVQPRPRRYVIAE
jgi:hypothetical protein